MKEKTLAVTPIPEQELLKTYPKEQLIDLLGQSEDQLKFAKRELDEFSYNVSHDLRAPLRAMDGFSKALSRSAEGKLNEQELRYLDIIMKNAEKMGKLIDGLLDFHRLGRHRRRESKIDMNLLFQSVFNNLLKSLQEERNIVFKLNKLPDLIADLELIKQVITQLLENSIKFINNKEKPCIEIGGWIENSDHVYYVKDNGAGFENEFSNKIFDMYQRLHGDEFDGTGVGLALVKRIIQLHEGKVWAESQVNKETTIYFSLPMNK